MSDRNVNKNHDNEKSRSSYLNDNGNVNWHIIILRSLLGDESVGLVADGSLPSIERTSSTDQGLKLARDMLCSRSTI